MVYQTTEYLTVLNINRLHAVKKKIDNQNNLRGLPTASGF